MAKSKANIVPLFCVETIDKRSTRKLFINFKANDEVEAPKVNIEEDKLVQEICNPSPNIETYVIPLQLSQIHWSKSDSTHGKGNNYVIDICINDKFALRKVISSEIIRHYLITVSLDAIEEKYNSGDVTKLAKQTLGHQLDLDQTGYAIIESCLKIEKSNEVVNNKVVILDTDATIPSHDAGSNDDTDIYPYDLHFRPKQMILTCSLNIDRIPDTISYNDDRILIMNDGKTILDVNLPLDINLNDPVRYRFDDRLCLLRIVFKLDEPNLKEYQIEESDDVQVTATTV